MIQHTFWIKFQQVPTSTLHLCHVIESTGELWSLEDDLYGSLPLFPSCGGHGLRATFSANPGLVARLYENIALHRTTFADLRGLAPVYRIQRRRARLSQTKILQQQSTLLPNVKLLTQTWPSKIPVRSHTAACDDCTRRSRFSLRFLCQYRAIQTTKVMTSRGKDIARKSSKASRFMMPWPSG